MHAVRERFHHVDRCPVTGEPRIFLESGGGSLKLKAAIAASAEVSALPDQEGRDNPASRHLSALIARGREDLHLLFGTAGRDGENLGAAHGAGRGRILCGETGTRLLYRFIREVALSAPPGPVLSSTLEHPASLDAARQWAQRTGRRWIEVPFDTRTGTLTAAHYAAAVTPDTQLATIIHTSMLTGFVADVPAITAAIRRVAPECFIVVDGIQHAPHGVMDVPAYGADAYVFSPYKAYSRLSLGFGWINDRLHAVPHEHMLGKDGADWELGSRDPSFFAAQSAVVDHYAWLGEQALAMGLELERAGQAAQALGRGWESDSGQVSMRVSREVSQEASGQPQLAEAAPPAKASGHDRARLVRLGAQAMAAHESALIQLLIHGDADTPGLLATPGITLVGPPTAEGREGLVSFNLRGVDSPDLVQHLAQRGIRVHARVTDGYSGHILGALGLQDCLRVSLAHYNTPDEVRACLRAVAGVQPR
jgi:selenocysteine lyase/cysteine desulfurase